MSKRYTVRVDAVRLTKIVLMLPARFLITITSKQETGARFRIFYPNGDSNG
jgi:hypothetical protein